MGRPRHGLAASLLCLLLIAGCRTAPPRPSAPGETPAQPSAAAADRAGGHRAAAGLADALPPGWPADSILRRLSGLGRSRGAGDPRPPPDSVGRLLPRRIMAPATRANDVDRYLLWLPPGLERANRAWPLILYLHGRSLRGDDLELVKRYGIPAFLDRGLALPFVVVAPQLPLPGGWEHPDRLAKLLEEVVARYPVDRSRIYLTGFSMGADGAWLLALAHPGPFAAAVPISAWTPDPARVDLEALRGLPVRVYHGTEDDITPIGRARTMADAMEAAGLDVRFTPLEGAGHGIVNDVYGRSAFYRWLLEHAKVSR